MTDTPALPLAGIRVLDLGSVAMAPYAAQWLGDLGADVIKVEAPVGDSTRRTGPTPEPGMAPIFLGVNRNKRSIVLDLKVPRAVDALLALVDTADVFLHSVRPQKLVKLRLDGASLLARNPRLVYAGFHGFEEAGPLGGQPAYDDIIQGLSGSADLMARTNGVPRYLPSIVADKTSGLVGAIAILGALVGRATTGRGMIVEVPMFETMTAFNLVEHLYGYHFDPPTGPMGYPRALSPDRRPLATADGYICMMPYTDAHWRAFFAETGSPELADDPRFSRIAARTAHIDALYDEAALRVACHSTEWWLATCERLEIPAGPVLALEDLQEHPHLRAVDFFATLEDAAIGSVNFPGVPVRFNGARPPVAFPPRLGEHTEQILGEVGFPATKAWAKVKHV